MTTRYLHGPATDQVLAEERLTGAGTLDVVLWAMPDHLGSVRTIVNDSGVTQNHLVFDSFGNVTSETSATLDFRYGFTGRERDPETGLNYHRNRYYDPSTGRWISEDPIGFAAGDVNVVRYVGNFVTGAVDPDGLEGRPLYFPQFGTSQQFPILSVPPDPGEFKLDLDGPAPPNLPQFPAGYQALEAFQRKLHEKKLQLRSQVLEYNRLAEAYNDALSESFFRNLERSLAWNNQNYCPRPYVNTEERSALYAAGVGAFGAFLKLGEKLATPFEWAGMDFTDQHQAVDRYFQEEMQGTPWDKESTEAAVDRWATYSAIMWWITVSAGAAEGLGLTSLPSTPVGPQLIGQAQLELQANLYIPGGYAAWQQMGRNPGLCPAPKGTVIIKEGKWDYFYGRVKSSPHNQARSLQNLKDLETLGFPDTEAGRAGLARLFEIGRHLPEASRHTTQYGITITRRVPAGNGGVIDVKYFYPGGDLNAVPEISTIIPKIFK